MALKRTDITELLQEVVLLNLVVPERGSCKLAIRHDKVWGSAPAEHGGGWGGLNAPRDFLCRSSSPHLCEVGELSTVDVIDTGIRFSLNNTLSIPMCDRPIFSVFF